LLWLRRLLWLHIVAAKEVEDGGLVVGGAKKVIYESVERF
jgi:hypothetical protein